MRVVFHPEFPKDVRRFEADYNKISEGLATRFRLEVDRAIEAIRKSPEGSGHYLQTGTEIVRSYRRRNLRSFPFFVLYGVGERNVIIGSLIPSRSDPLTWLT